MITQQQQGIAQVIATLDMDEWTGSTQMLTMIIDGLTEVFTATNPHFDGDGFAQACGLTERYTTALDDNPMTHVEHIEDTSGDLVDINYFCSAQCYTLSTGGDAYGHAWPGGSETDYDVMCHHCGTLLWRGLSS